MIVVLIGMDGTGKTELFQRLQKAYPKAVYIKESYPGANLVARYVRRDVFETFVRFNRDVTVIYDRATIIDDLVYEPIISKKPSYFDRDYERLSQLLKQCYVVYLTADLDLLKRRIEKRGDHFIGSDQLEAIQQSYQEVFEKLNISPYTIDTTTLTLDQVYDEAMAILRGETK